MRQGRSGKLSKAAFLAKLEASIRGQGYLKVPGPPAPAAALFAKSAGGLILSLGIEFSRLYLEKFTASFYLSSSFCWSLSFPDHPEAALRRIGSLLRIGERRRFVSARLGKRVVDVWWTGFTLDNVRLFAEAVSLAEPRFLSQPGLERRLREFKQLQEHRIRLDDVRRETSFFRRSAKGLTLQPKRYAKNVPAKWYWAAEKVARTLPAEYQNPNFVSMIALDAWRTETFSVALLA
jgi:hypothetical protein